MPRVLAGGGGLTPQRDAAQPQPPQSRAEQDGQERTAGAGAAAAQAGMKNPVPP